MNFIMGADVSSLQAMEDRGAKFYDLDGMESDALSILSAHGVNYIRLRLFNRPTESFDGGDYCDLEHTLEMAKRVKKQGLGLLLDFHYSDFWADWKQQSIPKDWENQSAKELEQSIYTYTKRYCWSFIDAVRRRILSRSVTRSGRGFCGISVGWNTPGRLRHF